MKLSLDIHGVIDKDPDKYAALARSVRANHGEVIIITGQSISAPLVAQLKNLGIEWDDIVSIQDELAKVGPIIGWKEGRPLFTSELWDGFKGRYCATHGIDLMIDDSLEYRPYFSTPFLLA
jgi:hypothetical protein